MANDHILVVEDESKIASLLRDYLEQAGYAVSILDRGDTVIPFVNERAPDLILLDIMLPGMDGMEVCRELRKKSRVPILMITARIEEIDCLLGLELGADDYICKPFSTREVIARVKAVLRRAYGESQDKVFVVGPIHLDSEKHRVKIKSGEIKLTPSEFGILQTMMESPEHVFSRNDLLQQIQGNESDGNDRIVDTHVKNLRKKISRQIPDIEVIASVYGVGYRLNSLDIN